tara:strand:+ start:1515 stop:1763 length:249 start_codon:yes stop_codon:yes gene_type:complete
VWWACFVFTLAKGRITKEIEEWVLWELPFSRALIYRHCSLRSNGEWTVPAEKPLEMQVQDTRDRTLRLIKDDDDDDPVDFDD